MEAICRSVEQGIGYKVRIFSHHVDSQFGPVACFSYVTDGLRASGQKEMILTVSDDREEAQPPMLPLQFFARVNELAVQGHVVDIGGFSYTEPPVGFMGNFRGILYEHSQSFAGVPAPADALMAILATEDEVEVAKRCGNSRVLVRLGDSYRYFPFPPWSDRARSSVVTQDFWRQSLLSRMPRLSAPGITVRQEGERVMVRLASRVAVIVNEMLSKLPDDRPITLCANLDPEADGMLVWQPGQREPRAIVPPGSKGERMGGCFIIMLPENLTNENELFEDGFISKLTTSSWQDVIEALRSGQPISIRGKAGSPVFDLSWMTSLASVAD
jgi:hypothetical protein